MAVLVSDILEYYIVNLFSNCSIESHFKFKNLKKPCFYVLSNVSYRLTLNSCRNEIFEHAEFHQMTRDFWSLEVPQYYTFVQNYVVPKKCANGSFEICDKNEECFLELEHRRGDLSKITTGCRQKSGCVCIYNYLLKIENLEYE